MIKLIDILREVQLQEKIVKVPIEALAKSKDIYAYIQANIKAIKKKAGETQDSAYKSPKLRNIINLQDLRGDDVSISIGIYNDSEDPAEARIDLNTDTIYINLYKLSSYEDFEDAIEHELVHAMDPKVRDSRIYYGDEKGRGGVEKKGAEPTGDEASLLKYTKSPWEFDAFTTPLINKLRSNLEKAGAERQGSLQLLKDLISDIKTKDIDTVLQNDKYVPLAWLFTRREKSRENWKAAWEDYTTELEKIYRWATKPTLYRQFLKRLGTEI